MDNATKSKTVNQEELTEEQLNKGMQDARFDQFTDMVNVRDLKMSLTQMMLRDVHQHSEDFSKEEVEDFTSLIFLLEDLE